MQKVQKLPDSHYWALFESLVMNDGWDEAVKCVYGYSIRTAPYDLKTNMRLLDMLRVAGINVGGPECLNMEPWFQTFYEILYHTGTPAEAFAYAAENTSDKDLFFKARAACLEKMPIEKQRVYFPGLRAADKGENYG